MKRILKIFLYFILALLIILLLLNPNIASFKNYALEFGDPPYTIYKRKSNYFIFSIYIKIGTTTQKYYGFAGNYFEIEDNPPVQQDAVIVPIDSVTSVRDSVKSVVDTAPDYGPNAHIWMDELGAYFNKYPNASDEELYKRFPHLDHNEKKLIEGVQYDQAKKEKEMTEYKLRTRFPELFRDELYYQLNK